MLNFILGKSYTFNTKAPGILGISITNAKLTGIFDYDTAITYDNIDLKYRTIYPVLPTGTPDDPRSCVFYRFQSESGERIILADQWIDSNTVEVVDHIVFSVTVMEASLSDISRVRDALLSLGYVKFVIKQI
jgi:hypothetical protein